MLTFVMILAACLAFGAWIFGRGIRILQALDDVDYHGAEMPIEHLQMRRRALSFKRIGGWFIAPGIIGLIILMFLVVGHIVDL